MAGPEEWLLPARVQKPAYSPAASQILICLILGFAPMAQSQTRPDVRSLPIRPGSPVLMTDTASALTKNDPLLVDPHEEQPLPGQEMTRAISSTPKAWQALCLVPDELPAGHRSPLAPRHGRSLPHPWWVIFREQTWAISRERRRIP